MKIAHINIYFRIPEDFDGDLNELLANIIEYRENKGNDNKIIKLNFKEELENSKTISKYGYDVLMRTAFTKAISEQNVKLFGDVKIYNT